MNPRHLLLACLLFSAAPCAFAQAGAPPAPSARIGVIGTPDTADLSALLTAELSNYPALSLVERQDLAKVGDEVKLQQLAGSDPVSLGQLVGADGLLLLGKSPDGLQVRFTAAGLGYALFDDRFRSDADVSHLAALIAQRVADAAPKLKLRPAEAIPISVLNLRSEVAVANSAEIERALTLLLESRLAAVPKYVILERRHASALTFERLLANSAQPVMKGVTVIDGTLTMPSAGQDNLTAHLRLRPAGAAPISLDVTGSARDLPAFAEAMTAALGAKMNVVTTAPAWQPQAEAREYLLEGIWGAQNHAEAPALEALDSAELLGEDLPDVICIRVPVLCGVAVGAVSVMTGQLETPADLHPEPRMDAMLRAFNEEARYENENMPARLRDVRPDLAPWSAVVIRRQGLARAAASLLQMLDQTHYPHTDDLRAVFRDYAGYDPLRGKFPQDPFISIRYADQLSETKEEEEAYYRMLLTSTADTKAWREVQQTLYRDSFCAHFYPEVNGSIHDRYGAYLNFLQGLINGPCRLNALLAYANAIIGTETKEQNEEADQAFEQELIVRRDQLFATKQLAPYLTQAFDLDHSREATVADPQVIALEHYLLQHSAQLDPHLVQTWHPDLFPPAEAPAFWNELQALAAKTPGDTLHADSMRREYIEHFGQPQTAASPSATPSAPPTPAGEKLVVDRFWYPPNAPGKPNLARNPMVAVPGGVWLAADFVRHDSDQPTCTAYCYHITFDPTHPDPFTTESFQIPAFDPVGITATTGAVYVVGGAWPVVGNCVVQQFDFNTRRFDSHPIPTSCDIFAVGDKIYLSLIGASLQEMSGGVALYDGTTFATRILASSRRRPAQNQFDDRPVYVARPIFAGCDSQPWATTQLGEIYGIKDRPGPWPRVIPSGCLSFAQTVGSRTILFGQPLVQNRETQGDIVFMVDSAKPNPDLWLGAPGPLWGTGTVGKLEPLPPQPAWSQHPVWQQPPVTEPLRTCYGFRDDDLFGYSIHMRTGATELVWYRHGQAAPVHIPLLFKVSPEGVNALKAMDDADDDPLKNQRRSHGLFPFTMYCTAQGICFIDLHSGFWFLPFSDVDAYMKAHSAAQL